MTECPEGYYEYPDDQTCRVNCKDESCKACDYTTDTCNECSKGKFLHGGTCWDKCPLPLFGLSSNQSCVKDCGSSSVAPYEKLVSYGGMCLTACPESSVLHVNECMNICPEGYYENSYDNSCIKECLEG